jgi:hypothetical protein
LNVRWLKITACAALWASLVVQKALKIAPKPHAATSRTRREDSNLLLGRRREHAMAALDDGSELYERKGNLTALARARTRARELG